MISPIQTDNRGEQGAALILTLGVISLMLMLAMSFTFTARLDREAASVNSDMIKARLLCESALERVMAYIAYDNLSDADGNGTLWSSGDERDGIFPAHRNNLFDTFDDGNKNIGAYYSTASGTANVEADDLLVDFNGFTLFDPGTTPQWINVPKSDGEIIGRFAYFVMDDSGKETNSSYFSWFHYANVGSPTQNDIESTKLMFSNAGEPDYEDTGLERYDLFRLHDVDSGDTASDNDVGKTAANMVEEIVGNDASNDGILWLENWIEAGTWPSAQARAKQIAANIIDYIDDDIVNDVTTNYNDDLDHVPTTDNATSPSYVGIELVPMLNDIRFLVSNISSYTDPDGSIAGTGTWSGDETWNPEITVTCNAEIVYPFSTITPKHDDDDPLFEPTLVGQNCQLTIEATISFVIDDNNDGTFDAIKTFNESFTWPAGGDFLTTYIDANSGMYYKIGENSISNTLQSAAPGRTTSQVQDVRITITSARLSRNDGVLWDYAESSEAAIDSANPYYSLYSIVDGTVVGVSTECCFFSEAADVLQNHNSGDWTWRQDSGSPVVASGDFAEAASDNTNLSGSIPYAFSIANEYPSPLPINFLTAVHRAESGRRTLNFFIHNTTDNGGNAYTDGDRNMLDQIWLRGGEVEETTGETTAINGLPLPTKIYSKYNPNVDWTSSSPDYDSVADTLFSGVTDIRSDIKTEVVDGDPLGGRVDQLNRIGSAVAGGNYEAHDEEEALLETENKISARHSFFTAAIIAQVVKNLNIPPTSVQNESNVTSYDGTNFCRIMAEQFILVRFARNNLVPNVADNFTDAKTGEAFTYVGTRPDGHMYYLSDTAFDTWLEAARVAAEIGGQPVCLETEEEWTDLEDMLHNGPAASSDDFWIGLRINGKPASPSAPSPAPVDEWTPTDPTDPSSDIPIWVWCNNGETATFTDWKTTAGEPDAQAVTDNPYPGHSNESAAVMAEHQLGANWEWYDVSHDNGGTPLRILIECEPKMTVLDYRYYEE